MLARLGLALFLMLLVGGNARADEVPFVSPAFGVTPGDIWTMSAEGTGRTNLTNSRDDELSPAWSPDRSKIAFVRYQASYSAANREIWVMNSDGSGQTRITSGSIDEAPSWSPDGSQIAFSRRSNYLDTGDIFVMNADGSDQTNLTNELAADESPDWSPDGSKIAYARTTSSGSGFDIYVMSSDGSDQRNLTYDSGILTERQPRWSPDGTRIAYTDAGGDRGDIYVMSAEGTGLTNLTSDIRQDSTPAWSGDSSRIAFTRWDNDNYELFTMNSDGSGQANLTNASWVHEMEPDLSRDGARIAYVSGPLFNLLSREIFRMSPEGSGQADLTNSPWTDDVDPSWSPRGDRIAFASRPTHNYDRVGREEVYFHIYVMNADGSGQTQLTRGSVDDRTPDWSSDGRRIVFDRGGEIHVMNADGTHVVSVGGGSNPAWSPDGSRIAVDGIDVMSTDGSGRTRLTGPYCECYSPAWSPDGSRIVFFWYHSGPFPESRVYVMDADGSNWTQLPAGGLDLAWSPDGTKIAGGGSLYGGGGSIFVMNADGSNPMNLSNYRRASDRSPDWSPDGGSIVFDTYRVPDGPQHPLPSSTPTVKGRLRPFLTPACFVPRVIGLRLAQAQRRIRQRGCRMGLLSGARFRRTGRVVAQKPRAGSRRELGSRVNLVVRRKRLN